MSTTSSPRSFSAVHPMRREDYPEVARIHAEGLQTGNAAFEDSIPDWDDFSATHIPQLSMVSEDMMTHEIFGWAAASPYSTRDTLSGLIIDSVYVSSAAQGKGIGEELLRHLISGARKDGRWTIHATIFEQNTGSLALHSSVGFTRIGTIHKMGYMTYGPHAETWRDAELYEYVL